MTEVHALPLHELRKRKSVKWRQFPSDVLPLPVAEMDFPIAEPIKSALHDMVDRSDTGYLGPFPEMFEAFAHFSQLRWKWSVDVSHMRIATDVGVGTVEVLRTLIGRGEKVMLNSPVYDNMWRWVAEVEATLVDVPLTNENGEYSLDLNNIEREYRDGVKVHILCHPHNPVGAIFTSDSLSQLASLAKRYGVHIISDEIHGPLVFERRDFTPFLAVSDDAKDVGVTVTSASKGFNLAGLKCAVIVTSSAAIREKINSMPISVAFRASLFGAVAATAAFRDSDSWLDGVVSTLNQNRELIRNLIDTKIPAIKYRAPDFGYLAWLDLSALQLGDDPAKTILERGKLALNGGHMYGPRNAQYVRMNFGTSPEIITEAFDRIMKSL
ncbi:MAG: aminotransferase class I/II-fold pyridoxal phosphate-dependent enzyme [Candidatus Nanopelagicaceae bacterium]|jgi:cystathionine beta-lyase|nr:aminotransferase class I/II-fold pyridoxal phosphate-dependent enzyme [Candidatus Nanopelagicaceae bacterium]